MARSRALRFAAALGLALAFAGPASATPPTEAQVDRYMEAIGLEGQYRLMQQQVLDSMQRGIRAQIPNPTKEEQRLIDEYQANMRDRLFGAIAWDKVAPIYRRVFMQQFTAEEVDAAIRFFTSPEGASLIRKQPAVMQAAMREVEPMVMEASRSLMEELQTDKGRAPSRRP